MIHYDSLLRIVEVVIGFALLLLFHEIGHFAAGVLLGVKVEKLSIGFGPKLFGFKRRGTEYMVALVPAGGYVKFKGDEPDSKESSEPDSFWGKPPGHRAVIIVAGVAMNAITAVLAFIIAFKIGVKTEAPVVGAVIPGSPAEVAGFKPLDRVLSVAGKRVIDFQDISYGVALAARGKSLDVEVLRNGQRQDLQVTPQYDRTRGMQSVGIAPLASLSVAAFMKDSEARKAAIQVGDVLVAIDGVVLKDWDHYDRIIRESPGKTVELTLKRGDSLLSMPVPVEAIYAWTIGAEGYPAVLTVREGWPAAEAGLRPGDIILSINGTPVPGEENIRDVVKDSAGSVLRIKALRDSSEIGTTLVPRREGETWMLGISYNVSTMLAAVKVGSPAAEAGMAPGDRIVSVDGRRVRSLPELGAMLQQAKGGKVEVSWARGSELLSGEVTPAKAETPPEGFLGIVPDAESDWVRLGLVDATRLGIARSVTTARYAVLTIKALLQRRVSPGNVGGPVFIGYALYERARQGISRLIYFFGMVSMWISFMNILPLPVLDGGHLVLLAAEKVKGSRLSTRSMQIWQYAGLVLVGLLFVFVLGNDLRRLLTGPF